MRRDQKTRLDKIATRRDRPASQWTDAELDKLIRDGVEAEGGAVASAAKARAEGNEEWTLFIEDYMASPTVEDWMKAGRIRT